MLDCKDTESSLIPPYHAFLDTLLFSFLVEFFFSFSFLSSVDLERWFAL